MTTLTEGRHAAEFVLSEANGGRSRESVTVGAGADLKAGTVVGIETASGEYLASPATGSTGEETAVAVLLYDANAASAAVDNVAVIARDAEVNGNILAYDASVDTAPEIAAKATQLAAVGIIVR